MDVLVRGRVRGRPPAPAPSRAGDNRWKVAATRSTGRRRSPFPGCTACVALVLGDVAYVANAGDCRAVMCVDYDSDAHVALAGPRRGYQRGRAVTVRKRAVVRALLVANRQGRGHVAGGRRRSWLLTRALGDADCKRDGVTAMRLDRWTSTPAHSTASSRATGCGTF